MTLGAVGYASQSITLVMVFLGLAGFFLGVASSGLIALAPSLYSTAIRSTGVGWAMGLGRLGSFVGPLAIGQLVNRGWPVGDSFIAIGAPALCAALFTSLIGINRKEKTFRVPPLEDKNLMSSIQTQFLNLKVHHSQYPAIDPQTALKGSASGKIIYIAGASQGIGQATAVAFAQAGAKAIYVTARSEEALQETKTQVNKANPETRCEYMVCDVTDEEQVKASIMECVAKFGGIDVVDSNAGYLNHWKKIGESDPTSWWKTWEVNLKGTYYLIRYTISYLIESAKKHSAGGSSGGHLILISSIGAQMVRPTASDYQTSKHAINRLCEFVNVDHGGDGVKCFAIHPGGVPTLLAKNMPKELHANLVDEPNLAAGFAVWLCSGKADWAKGRYLSSNWDIDELMQLKDQIIQDDLLVNRLRTKA
jgi:NAD(P)-dependent dehydrogenase (short-subunit alcohol dehydrogenase family)